MAPSHFQKKDSHLLFMDIEWPPLSSESGNVDSISAFPTWKWDFYTANPTRICSWNMFAADRPEYISKVNSILKVWFLFGHSRLSSALNWLKITIPEEWKKISADTVRRITGSRPEKCLLYESCMDVMDTTPSIAARGRVWENRQPRDWNPKRLRTV